MTTHLPKLKVEPLLIKISDRHHGHKHGGLGGGRDASLELHVLTGHNKAVVLLQSM